MNRKLIPTLRFPEFNKDSAWQQKALAELGELVSGLTYSPNDVREEGMLVLRSSNIQNGKISLEDCVYVRPEINGANISKPNDILICVRNGSKNLIGKNALIPENLPLATHGAFMTVFRSERANFVFQLFQTPDYQRQVDGDLGATINSINGSNFLKYVFSVPSDGEQQKIADCLSLLDDLIAAHSQKLDLLKDHKKGLMQDLFPAEGESVPRVRFEEFEGEWMEEKLGNVGSFYKGKGISKVDVEMNGVTPCVRYGELYTHYGEIIRDVISYTNVPIEELVISKGNDVIIPSSGETKEDIATASCVINDGIALGGDLNIIRTNLDGVYLAYYLNNAKKQDISKLAQGISVVHLYNQQLKLLDIRVPPTLSEQQKIADCLSSLDDQIQAQTQKIEALKLHKKGLMQQLFPNPENA